MVKSLPQANPTLDKMSARLGLAGAGKMGPVLKGFAANLEITLDADEILDSARIYDDLGFNTGALSGTYTSLGSGRRQWAKEIIFGTHTSYGNPGGPAIRNFIEWTIRKKIIDPPSGIPDNWDEDIDREYFDANRTYQLSHYATIYDAECSEASGCCWRDDQRSLYIISDNGWIKVVDEDGTAQQANIELPAAEGFYDPEAIVYLGSDRFAVLDEGVNGSRSPRIHLFHLTVGQADLLDDIITKELPSITEFAGGLGAEGLAYDSYRNVYYVGTQPTGADQGGLWEVDLTTEDSDGYPTQTLLFHWSEMSTLPPSGCVMGDLEFSRDLHGGQFNDSIFVLFRESDSNPLHKHRKIYQVARDGTVLSIFGYGISAKVEGLAITPYTEQLFVVREGSGPGFYRFEHTGYEEEYTFERQVYVKNLPTKGSVYFANQEAQLGEAIVFINPNDKNSYAKDATFGINILPTFVDEFFLQHEYQGNRYAQTLRNWGGAATVEIFFDDGNHIDEMDIADLDGYYWEDPDPGLHWVRIRLRAQEGSTNFVDIIGYIRFRQFECPT